MLFRSVNSIQDVYEDPFVTARNTVHQFVRDDGTKVPTVAFPGKLSETPTDFRHAPPRVGEHSREILTDWLSLDPAALDALERQAAIVQRASMPARD